MNKHFVFVFKQENPAFVKVLQHVLSPFGLVDLVHWDKIDSIQPDQYTLAFLDAGIVADEEGPDNLTQFVSEVCQRWPIAKFILITASPTWRRAKEVLQAGAVDYIRQTLDEDRLRRELNMSLKYYVIGENKEKEI
jgi:DNA-binding NtrC family response regulator